MLRLFFRRLLMVSCAVVLLSFSFVVAPSSSVAHAHTSLVNGGARLHAGGCTQNLVAAHVSGMNQDGYHADWDSSWAREWNGRPDQGSFDTWNWYWKPDSSITITTRYSDGSSYVSGVRIPPDNTQDPYPVNCYYSISG